MSMKAESENKLPFDEASAKEAACHKYGRDFTKPREYRREGFIEGARWQARRSAEQPEDSAQRFADGKCAAPNRITSPEPEWLPKINTVEYRNAVTPHLRHLLKLYHENDGIIMDDELRFFLDNVLIATHDAIDRLVPTVQSQGPVLPVAAYGDDAGMLRDIENRKKMLRAVGFSDVADIWSNLEAEVIRLRVKQALHPALPQLYERYDLAMKRVRESGLDKRPYWSGEATGLEIAINLLGGTTDDR